MEKLRLLEKQSFSNGNPMFPSGKPGFPFGKV